MNPTNILEHFYRDSVTREAVKEFLIEQLKEMAVNATFEGRPVAGIQDAKKCIEGAFTQLEVIYGIINEQEIPNSK